MEVVSRSPAASVAGKSPRGTPPLEFALYLWHLLRLLLSGVATLAVYITTPLSWLKAKQAYGIPQKRGHECAKSTVRIGGSIEFHSGKLFLLQPIAKTDQGKMTVVLDLDETLISSHQAGKVPAGLRSAGAQGVELKCDGSSEGKSSRVVMFLRPGVFEFLRRLTNFAEVVLFTAGVPAYAEPLANALDPARKFFSARLYRHDTVNTVWYRYVKDLSRLGRDLRRTVLVDNSPYSFMLQPANGIPCVPFRGYAGDQQLLEVILPLLECLSYLGDIRPVLNNHFKMASWFRARGCNVQLDF